MTYVPGTEVATFPEGSQFEGGESAFLCVFFGCADIAASNRPGTFPLQSWEWTDQRADSLANEVQGNGAVVTSLGASLEDEHNALNILHLPWKDLGVSATSDHTHDINAVKAAIQLGVPVLICGAETGFWDKDFGGVPYTWTPTGNHCIVATGYDLNGDLIVRDYAAVGHAWVPGSRRTYLQSHMFLVSATAVWPYWKDRTMIPAGWHDDGSTLTAINGHKVVLGFRSYILDHTWDPNDQPLMEEAHSSNVLLHNPQGPGQYQITRDHMLWFTPAKGVINEPFMGLELFASYQLLAKLASQPTAVGPDEASFVDAVTAAFKKFETALQDPNAQAGGLPVTSALVQLAGDISAALQKLVPPSGSPSPTSGGGPAVPSELTLEPPA